MAQLGPSEETKEDITELSLTSNSIQIASDLHLEFSGTIDIMTQIESKSPVLALCGDIGWPQKEEYTKFLKDMSIKFKYVIVISGNHEYYYGEYHEVNDKIKSITQSISNNIYFLQRETLELDDVLPNIRILGTTLWCDYEKKSYNNFKEIVNDFQRIYWDKNYCNNKQKKIKKINVDNKKDDEDNKEEDIPFIEPYDINKLHKEDVLWLKEELKKAKSDGKRVIILTHHAPTDFACNGLDINKTPVSYATNYSNLEYLFKSPLIFWGFGHTHYNADVLIKTDKNWFIRFATNQSGYQYQKKAQYYLSSKVIEFYHNDFWIKNIDKTNESKQKQIVIKFNDTKKARNVIIIKNEKEIKLQITMIEYQQLMKNINIKKNYVPRDEKNGDCILM